MNDNSFLNIQGLTSILSRLNKKIGNIPISSKTISIIDYLNEINQKNVKSIYLGDQILSPSSSGVVTLPKATQEKYGVVIGSLEENKISINEDGTMEINSINLNRIFQNPNDELILNSGNA